MSFTLTTKIIISRIGTDVIVLATVLTQFLEEKVKV